MSNILLCGDPADPLHDLLVRRCEDAGHHVSFYIHPKRQEFAPFDTSEYVEDIMQNLEELEGELDLSFSRKYLPEPFKPEKSYYDVVMAYEMDPYEEVSHTFRDYLLRKTKLGFDGVILLPCYAMTVTLAASQNPEYASRIVGYSAMGLYTGQTTVELAVSDATSDAALRSARRYFESLGLKTILVGDTPGLILPRTLAMLVNEAASALMEDVASPEDIDTAMRLGTNYPVGPLAWADQVGIDVLRQVLYHLFSEYGEDRYRPMPLLSKLVRLDKLGVKTGEGFYKYPEEIPEVSAKNTAPEQTV